MRVVKAFAAEPRQLARFEHSVTRVFDQSMVATRLRAYYNPFIGFLPSVGLAVILLVGGRQVIDGTLSLGDFTAFYTYLLMLIGPMRQLGIALGLAQRATASGARLFEILDRAPGSRRRPARRRCPAGRGRVELRDVTFQYETARARRRCATSTSSSRPARRSRSSAATGSGKTTLVQLLARLYDVTEGAVLIDGADVRDVDLASLRRAISVVDDDPFLFSATVHENIAYGRPDATPRGGRARRRARAGRRLHRRAARRATTRGSASAG